MVPLILEDGVLNMSSSVREIEMKKVILASLIGTGLMLAQTPTSKNPVNDATQSATKHHRKVKVKKDKSTVETDIPAPSKDTKSQAK